MAETTVIASWDDIAEVWVATSQDVPGLQTTALSIPELKKKLRVAVAAPFHLMIRGDIRETAAVSVYVAKNKMDLS